MPSIPYISITSPSIGSAAYSFPTSSIVYANATYGNTAQFTSLIPGQPVLDRYGTTSYYDDYGNLHRLDGPARIDRYNNKAWYLHGIDHRDNGPSYEGANGELHWKVQGNYHRTDGPALILSTGEKHWFLNGKRHRLDGAAIEWSDGRQDQDFFINGRQVHVKSLNAFQRYLHADKYM
jgi:hypothetical protein